MKGSGYEDYRSAKWGELRVFAEYYRRINQPVRDRLGANASAKSVMNLSGFLEIEVLQRRDISGLWMIPRCHTATRRLPRLGVETARSL